MKISAFQRNAQPSPQVMISGVWGRTCHPTAFWQEYRKRIPAKIRNLTEDCIACQDGFTCFELFSVVGKS